jgi:hypothetical protein
MRATATWNWRRIAYFGALVLDLPVLISSASIFGTFIAIIWIAASRTTWIRPWLDAGTRGR